MGPEGYLATHFTRALTDWAGARVEAARARSFAPRQHRHALRPRTRSGGLRRDSPASSGRLTAGSAQLARVRRAASAHAA